jgi:hypothetical protein
MPILKKAKIMRSSPMSAYSHDSSHPYFGWREEDQPCWVDACVEEQITLTFNIKAGRGETELCVEINKADFPVILEEIAKATPEAAALFSKYAKKSLELNNNFNQKK